MTTNQAWDGLEVPARDLAKSIRQLGEVAARMCAEFVENMNPGASRRRAQQRQIDRHMSRCAVRRERRRRQRR